MLYQRVIQLGSGKSLSPLDLERNTRDSIWLSYLRYSVFTAYWRERRIGLGVGYINSENHCSIAKAFRCGNTYGALPYCGGTLASAYGNI